MSEGRQRTLCVDFDGVIHSYASEWKGACIIPDPPVPGAFEWLTEMVDYKDESGNTFKICIYSSRSKEPGAIGAMREWFEEHGLPAAVFAQLEFPTQKPPAFLLIDDRAYCFEGTFPEAPWIIDYKSWVKR